MESRSTYPVVPKDVEHSQVKRRSIFPVQNFLAKNRTSRTIIFGQRNGEENTNCKTGPYSRILAEARVEAEEGEVGGEEWGAVPEGGNTMPILEPFHGWSVGGSVDACTVARDMEGGVIHFAKRRCVDL